MQQAADVVEDVTLFCRRSCRVAELEDDAGDVVDAAVRGRLLALVGLEIEFAVTWFGLRRSSAGSTDRCMSPRMRDRG